MDREKPQTFVLAAEADLASIRSSLLILTQSGDATDITVTRRHLARLNAQATASQLPGIAELCSECEASLDNFPNTDTISPAAVYAALDIVARIEAAVWQSDDFLFDVAGLVDASFDKFILHNESVELSTAKEEEFEIDEETLDIFRSEADELLTNIADGLCTLSTSQGDQIALWDVRRAAHTFKGAAGIVGLKEASEIAHRMEDILDRVVEMRREAVPQVVNHLKKCADRLNSIVAARDLDENTEDIDHQYVDVMSWLSSPVIADSDIQPNSDDLPDKAVQSRLDSVKTTTTPIVRVSLDRLDELIKISRSLLVNRSAIAERFTEYSTGTGGGGADSLAILESLFDAQRNLTDEIQAKLLHIRMVRFGNLETRLSRTVHLTCVDENKKAILVIENGEVEIDTQIIDALVEPLLHLLKNAVVHGIESPDTRRMIGKPERGNIRIRLEADDEALVMSVTDDGGGISAPKLIEQALANGIITADQAKSISDREATQLIFDRGLTTAGKIDLNAGRGVGMSIVRESIENRGGKVMVESVPQRGTTFTILMPFAIAKPVPLTAEPSKVANKPVGSMLPLVLIVDDSASIRRQTANLVKQAGLRVITANNGAEALELLLSGDWEPDLILSDVEMPQIDGWEFLEYVKTDNHLGEIPVVMVTSLAPEIHRQRAFDLGAMDFIVKPLTERHLARVLQNLENPLIV